MPLIRPTLRELIDRAQEDLNARLPGADARLRRSILSVIARVHAAATHGLYGYADYIAEQLFADTADDEHLVRIANMYGIQVAEAQKATGTALFTGVNGFTVPSGALLETASHLQFITTGSGEVAAGEVSIPVEAVLPAEVSNLVTGTVLSLVTPVPGINSTPILIEAPGLVGGTDPEGTEELRARVLAHLRTPPRGGAAQDYVFWARTVAGVTRVFVLPNYNGEGTVGVTFMMDGRVDPIPLQADVDAVEAAIEAKRPVTADVSVFAPTPVEQDYEIAPSPDTPEIRAAIEAELRELHKRDAVPGGNLELSRIIEAISLGRGEHHHDLISPAVDPTVDEDYKVLVFGAITWS